MGCAFPPLCMLVILSRPYISDVIIVVGGASGDAHRRAARDRPRDVGKALRHGRGNRSMSRYINLEQSHSPA